MQSGSGRVGSDTPPCPIPYACIVQMTITLLLCVQSERFQWFLKPETLCFIHIIEHSENFTNTCPRSRKISHSVTEDADSRPDSGSGETERVTEWITDQIQCWKMQVKWSSQVTRPPSRFTDGFVTKGATEGAISEEERYSQPGSISLSTFYITEALSAFLCQVFTCFTLLYV